MAVVGAVVHASLGVGDGVLVVVEVDAVVLVVDVRWCLWLGAVAVGAPPAAEIAVAEQAVSAAAASAVAAWLSP